MPSDNYSIQRIADRMEIQDQLHLFSRGVDRKDWSLALSVYHPDATDNHGIYNGSAQGFIEHVKKRHETVLMSMHHLSNIIIEFVDADRALVESYCFAWQSLSPGNTDMRAAVERESGKSDRPLELLMVSRYVDQFTRKNGAWRIQERQVVSESSMKVTPEATGPNMGNVMEKGRRDESDFLMAMRHKLFAGTY
jgi:hypothetical protein